jgi:hypothetical protein
MTLFVRVSLTRREPAEATAVQPAAPPEPPAAALPEGAPRLLDWVGVLAMGTGLFYGDDGRTDCYQLVDLDPGRREALVLT